MKQNFCYVFYFCMGLLVLVIHAVGLTSDPESLAMLIVLGWPVSAPVIVCCILLPAILVARITFSAAPRDKLLIVWFFVNLSFWIVFINSYVFFFKVLVFPTPVVFALSYLYALLAISLPVIRKMFSTSLNQALALSLTLLSCLVGIYFFDFQQGHFSSKQPLSADSRYLLDAIDRGDLTNVKRILASGADLRARDEHGWDSLIHAVYWRHTEIVEYLLELGIDPNTRENKSGVRKLGPEGKAGQVISGRSALEYALRQKPPDILWLLLQHNARSETEIEGLSELAIAAGRDNIADVQAALQRVDSTREDELAVRLAAMNASDETLRLLLEVGADPTAGIFEAVRKSRLANLILLLESGADPNAIDHSWWTSLAYARTAEIAQILISAGADVNYINPGGYPSENSVLTKVAGEEVPDVVAVLIAAGANVNYQNYHGYTALMTAVDVETIEILVKAGAETNKVDREGRTVIDHLKSRGMTSILPMLAD